MKAAFCALACMLALPAAAGAAPALLSLDFRDVDVYDAARMLAAQGAANVVLDASVRHHPVTMRLQRVSLEVALEAFARANDLSIRRSGDIIYFASNDAARRTTLLADAPTRVFALRNAQADAVARQLQDSLPAGSIVLGDKRAATIVVTAPQAALDRAGDLLKALDRAPDAEPLTVPMRYVKSSDAVKALVAALAPAPPFAVYAAEQQNAVIAIGSEAFLEKVKTFVARIDRPGRQVRYDVRVADVSPSDTSNVGILFGGVALGGQPTPGQAATAFVRNSLALNATINALVVKGDASILAQPSLSTLNNVQASLLVGQQFPIVYFDARTGTQQVQFVNVGVNLTVSPSIGEDGSVTTELQTDYSTIVNFVNNFPIIGTRRAQSTLRVHDGETIVIAGLFQELDARTLSKVPFLGDIPLFGELFRNRSRSHVRDEVIFMLTPHLVQDKEPS